MSDDLGNIDFSHHNAVHRQLQLLLHMGLPSFDRERLVHEPHSALGYQPPAPKAIITQP